MPTVGTVACGRLHEVCPAGAAPGHTYDGIIMDPPSYGRGPGGEVWKLEEQLYSLVSQCIPILSEKPLFFILNSLHDMAFPRR